jgi:hypothetical protein
VEQQDLAKERLETRSTNQRKRPPRCKANGEKLMAPDQKKQLFIEDSNEITTGPWRSPPSSHPHLTGNVKCVLVSLLHYKSENEIGSGKEPHPLKGPIYRPKQKAK